jgi:hypothetical protein
VLAALHFGKHIDAIRKKQGPVQRIAKPGRNANGKRFNE